MQRQGLLRCSNPIRRLHRRQPDETSTQNRKDHPVVSHVRPAKFAAIAIVLASRNEQFVLPRKGSCGLTRSELCNGAVLRFCFVSREFKQGCVTAKAAPSRSFASRRLFTGIARQV